MDWRRVGAGVVAAAAALGTGGTVAVDANINPYEVTAEKYELASMSTIECAGGNKVEAHRDRPAITLSKWDGEAAMTVAYRAINVEGSRQFLTERIEWKADSEEVHAYPLPAGEGMEVRGFEIEIVLDEASDNNVFEFDVEGAGELDFFYQPELTAEEIAEGAVRPENIVGSYAVYHKSKANHREADTNYATGKAYHIYRPKAFADGAETWAELAYADVVLSVTVPQEWLEKATYLARAPVDPTFGFTSLGGNVRTDATAVPWAYLGLKVGGGAYLIFLGIQLWRGAREPIAMDGPSADGSGGLRKAFLLGLATQLSNPKTAIAYASIFSALLPADPPAWVGGVILPTIFLIETGWYAIVSLVFSSERPRRGYLGAKHVFVRLHARGSGRHLREAVRQADASLVARPPVEAARLLAAKDAAQPSAEGPGRSSGL